MTSIHGHSYLVSLEIVVGYKELRSSQGTQVNLSVLLEKPEITYRRTLNTEYPESSCRITLFQWEPPVFPNITWDKGSL